ncbi:MULTISPECIES: substrate-binding periplasmic protein [Aidingimonas]|uniref:Amino acid ABC transporter substrate-binding protein, PAAT family n=1 Tax=Aidingimonas halophila TaxID=574349 RepID=A0A1H3CWQ6_9GAMM|nr:MULTISPECIES: ABC transporter substrate-binding protein [Aidingimonas]GHC30901.1 amino acid ABC transporter substrate-binding protein [Aidingimonas halophila]SDX58652.1 amino acid ABC transporter substrate-binding protein, PAAT family [Aidingimonas halophila]
MTASRTLRVICADLPAPPLFERDERGERHGYEADVARLIAEQLGRRVEWVYRQWSDFYPALDAGEGDLLLCGQGISDYRKTLGDFTRPYAIFDESVMVRSGSGITSPQHLEGLRVGAIANSLNMTLTETFTGVVPVPFDGASDDVFGDMVAALRSGDIDALVDDDVALVPLEADDLTIAFTVPTRNAWGAVVAKRQPDWLASVNRALDEIIANGALKSTWERWMPTLDYPFEAGQPVQ